MPFGLRNAGTTFQRLIDKVFEKKIGRNMEAYIDDVIDHSKVKEDHLANLQ